MRRIPPLNGMVWSLLLALIASVSAHAGEMGMSDRQALEKNKQLVRRLYEECVNPGKLELLPEFVADEFPGPRGEKGPAAFAANVQSLRQGFPDIRFTVEDLVAEGERVAVRWTWRGTHTGTFNGIPPSEKPVTNEGTVIYQIRDGRIVRNWLLVDRLGALQQIGLIPTDLAALRLPPGGRAGVVHISVSIDRAPGDVYAFASDLANFPKWATGLGGSIRDVNGEWVAEAPMGRITIRMADKNELGVLDHDVTLASGETIHNPMRVLPRGAGSEVVFTLFRRPGVTDEELTRDAQWVEKDLKILKGLLEK